MRPVIRFAASSANRLCARSSSINTVESFGTQSKSLLSNRSAPFSTSSVAFSGHNKWSTIKHDKAKNDANKNKMATKYGAQIAVAARLGGPDPAHNFRLSTAIENAQRYNVPKKIIESAIKRGAGLDKDSNGASAEMAVYEGMGPGGIAFVVEALTDNKSRTISQVKSTFTKATGVMSPTAFMFTRRGWIEASLKEGMETVDDAFEELIEFGAEDIEEDEAVSGGETGGSPDAPSIYVYTSIQGTAKIAESMKSSGYQIKDMGIEYAPNADTSISESDLKPDVKAAYEKLAQQLDDLDDVIEVYTNVV